MIIDDDPNIIEALTSLIGQYYCLVSCLNFEEAARKLTPDVRMVLLDIKMAAKDGIEVFKLLKEKQPNLPIVFHSAYPGSSEKAAEVDRFDHSGYLTKGEYSFPSLLAAIRAAIG